MLFGHVEYRMTVIFSRKFPISLFQPLSPGYIKMAFTFILIWKAEARPSTGWGLSLALWVDRKAKAWG